MTRAQSHLVTWWFPNATNTPRAAFHRLLMGRRPGDVGLPKQQVALPTPLLLISVVLVSCVFDLFIGSASAKWSALAPIVVPMFMLLGISPEMTTAAYRMGDSVTNIATPLMSYFPLILTFAQRWDPRFGLGSLMATMLPYAGAFLVAGLMMVAAWVARSTCPWDRGWACITSRRRRLWPVRRRPTAAFWGPTRRRGLRRRPPHDDPRRFRRNPA